MVLSDKTHEPQGRHHVRQKLPDDGDGAPTFSKASCLSQTCLFHDNFLLHIKNSGHLVDKRQIPAQKVLIKQKRLSSYKDRRKTCGTTLLHSKSRAPHCRMPTHSSALTRLARCAILSEDFYAPSVVHLPDCHDPDSTVPDSLCAHLLTLSPHHWFLIGLFN